MSSATFKGVVHGKTIELDQEPGLPDGQAVTVTIQRVANTPSGPLPEPPPPVETWCHRILFDSAVLPTDKIVKGTRLAAEALVAELEQGKSDAELLQAHPELTPEDVTALRNYARTPLGLRRSFGAWAEDAEELDKFLEWNREQRKRDRREIDE
jgi:uncharacterized protein (DUF433 family)